MVPKKSLFERMGLIEPSHKEENDVVAEETTVEDATLIVPDPEHVPDLTKITEKMSLETTDTLDAVKPVEKTEVDPH